MLLTNGRIYTLDARGTVGDTLVVRDGRVAFAGRRADVNAAPGEETVDLGGRAALPGLVDAHGHLMHLARVRLTLDLRGAQSEEAAARRVSESAARLPRGEWISGRNWDQNLWPGARFPSTSPSVCYRRFGSGEFKVPTASVRTTTLPAPGQTPSAWRSPARWPVASRARAALHRASGRRWPGCR